MIFSMTGYASVARDIGSAVLNIDLRSVNHRYLDLQFRMPEELRALEPSLREIALGRLQRGKVECRIGMGPVAAGTKNLDLNLEVLRQLRALSEQLRLAWPSVAGLTANEILQWPGILVSNSLAAEDLREACISGLNAALEEFTSARAREGERLRELLLERVSAMEKRISTVVPRMPQAIASFRDKLASRLREAMAGSDEERVRQEIAVFAVRIDVDEELSRLTTHLDETKRVLSVGGAVGKRLDFLMQELNREANTLASKAIDIEVTNTAIELKLLIEQMREQIQNIE
jgi:uncharacterized protein (TIGR00255 family)